MKTVPFIEKSISLIVENNQLDSQLFMYVYFYFLHVAIIRRIIVSVRHLVYVSLCRWPSGMRVKRAYQTVIYTE